MTGILDVLAFTIYMNIVEVIATRYTPRRLKFIANGISINWFGSSIIIKWLITNNKIDNNMQPKKIYVTRGSINNSKPFIRLIACRL